MFLMSEVRVYKRKSLQCRVLWRVKRWRGQPKNLADSGRGGASSREGERAGPNEFQLAVCGSKISPRLKPQGYLALKMTLIP